MAQTPDVHEFLAAIEAAANSTREDIPGWVIRRPLLADVADHLTFIEAVSKPAEDMPFMLPRGVESCICVIEGSVAVAASPLAIVGGTLWTVHAHESREITSLVHPTRIFCIFFKAGGDNEQRAVDTR